MHDNDELYELENVECIAATEKAILVKGGDLDSQEWIPQSQIHDDSDVFAKGNKGSLIISLWLAQQKGWV